MSKIYAKLLAKHLMHVLPSLIKKDYTGFVTGRQASDATRRALNIIHHAGITRMPSLLLSVDAEKAFNRVNWLYMYMVLQKFGFQDSIFAILALYATPSAQINTTGLLSKPFAMSNTTRQGCPLSPTIFNLMIEPLTEKIRSHPAITGFTFRDSVHKINLFAGDIVLFLTKPESWNNSVISPTI